jgi:hypothetical protein
MTQCFGLGHRIQNKIPRVLPFKTKNQALMWLGGK